MALTTKNEEKLKIQREVKELYLQGTPPDTIAEQIGKTKQQVIGILNYLKIYKKPEKTITIEKEKLLETGYFSETDLQRVPKKFIQKIVKYFLD